jgi:hypothetical protein
MIRRKAKGKSLVVSSQKGVRLKAQGARGKFSLLLPCALCLAPCAFSQSEIRNPKFAIISLCPMPYALTYSLLHAAGCSLPAAGFF